MKRQTILDSYSRLMHFATSAYYKAASVLMIRHVFDRRGFHGDVSGLWRRVVLW